MKHWSAWASIFSVSLALLVCFLAMAASKGSVETAFQAYNAMLWGGLGDFPQFFQGADFSVLSRPWGEACSKAAILTLTGLSVAVAFRVGMFNIGAQGQLLWGALTAAVLGAWVQLPVGLHVPLCLVGAALAGGIYGWLPAYLKIRRGVHEVISTMMLNWIAAHLIENALVIGPLQARATGTHSVSGTDEIFATAQLPKLLGDASRLHVGFLLAFGLALAIWFWMEKTPHGFEMRVVGLGPQAAWTAGIPVETRIQQAMSLSGALAGLAGAVLVLGTEYKFPATLGTPYGFDGIAMALIAQTHAVGVFLTSFFFGILRAGGTRMQLWGVHKSFPELIQGLALLFVAGKMMWQWVLRRGTQRPEESSRA